FMQLARPPRATLFPYTTLFRSMQPPNDIDRAAVAMGVTIDARDAFGSPRLIRAIVPRHSSVAGMTADQAARDHLAALTPLYMQRSEEHTSELQSRSDLVCRLLL